MKNLILSVLLIFGYGLVQAADFTYSIEANGDVTFTAFDIDDLEYGRFYFPDGTSSPAYNPVTKSLPCGVNTIQLKIWQDDMSIVIISRDVVIGPYPNPAIGAATNWSRTVNFSGTNQNGGTATSWDWTFSDGTTATSRLVSKTFPSWGTHSATLTVTNTCGLTETANVTVVLEP